MGFYLLTFHCGNKTILYEPIIRYKEIIKQCNRLYVRKTQQNDSEVKFDMIDDFTTNLIKQKCFKWDLPSIQITSKLFRTARLNTVDIRLMNEKQLLQFVETCMENSNLDNTFLVIDQILKHKYTVPFNVLTRLLIIIAQKGDKENINALICLHTENLTETQLKYCNIFLAEAAWIKGNIEESIKLFKNVYVILPRVRNQIKVLIEYLINITIEKRTEATLVQILKLSNELCMEYNDYSLLIALWKTCFLSQWFSDQMLALDLLENNEILRDRMRPNFIFLVVIALKLHRVEVVQRLFETLLKFKMKEEYIHVMQLLFDYHCLHKNFRRCSEIIGWSSSLELHLRPDQNERYLQLFLQQPISTNKNSEYFKLKLAPKFMLKF